MSFRDLPGTRLGHASKQQPKQRRADDQDSSFERAIRANVQEMQDAVRKAGEKLEQAQRSRLTKRASDALDRDIEKSEELSEETARVFRDWTVHLAGEPTERHRKRFSFEKLQKAYSEEVEHLQEVSRRAAAAQQEASAAEARQRHLNDRLGAPRECTSIVEDQDDAGALDDGAENISFLTGEVQEDPALANVAQEREDGIRRIQNQVTEVNQMFRDLASIVQEQGAQFTTIENSAESAAANTQQAVQELRKAVDRQRGTRERLCCMLMVAVALLCFVILPHLHAMHPRFAPPSPGAYQLPPNAGQLQSMPPGASLLDAGTRQQRAANEAGAGSKGSSLRAGQPSGP